MPEARRQPTVMAQDTGNPVLDSTVNLAMAFLAGGGTLNADTIETIVGEIHPKILEIAKLEPGGLRSPGGASYRFSVEAQKRERKRLSELKKGES